MLQAEKYLSWILKGGLLLTPFLVFIVTRSLYFPFITGKNFAFRILIEILAAIWVYAALRFPNFRPRSSAVSWAVVAFIAVMGLATVFSLSPYRSFWSNFERMEGYIGLLHFFLYFLILISVFKTERDWSVFFHTSLGASVIVSLYALFQLAGRLAIHQGGDRVDATLGNATYLAAYLLFHLFFLIWFLLRSQNFYGRLAYGAVFLLEAVILYYTATRGAVLGLLGGLVILAALLAIVERGLLRRMALAGLGVVMLLPIAFFLVKDAEFVKKNDVLIRFASISPQETTTRARFTIWNMAFQGFRERPIIGWGQESFVYVFSKYYDPSLWRQEPWFDRAHNVFLDWLTAGGVLGLAGYLGIFASAGWLLARSFRAKVLNGISFSVIAALLAAHFFQIIFVFDNLTSWLLFFAVLAYVHHVRGEPRRHVGAAAPLARASNVVHSVSIPLARATVPAVPSKPSLILPSGLPAAVGVFTAVVMAFVFYFANLKPILAAKAILNALQTVQTHEPAGKVDAVMAIFQKGLTLNSFGAMELREQISQTADKLLRDVSLANQDKMKFLDFAVRELEAQRLAFPSDMRAKAFLATLYTSAGRPTEAIRVVNEALEISGRRQQFYFVAAEAYLNAGERSRAIETLRRAYDLAPEYPEAISNLATVLILSGEDKEAEELFMKHYGRKMLINRHFAEVFAQRGSFDRSLAIWKELVAQNPQNAQFHAGLGVIYAQVGQAEAGIRELEEAIRLEPRFKAQGEQIIQGIKSGQIR